MRIGQQSADQLPWFHIVTLLTKVAEPAAREWYAGQAIQNAWSRVTLESQIKSRLHARQGAAVTNFDQRLGAPHAALAVEMLKDPYHFNFLGLGDEAHERDIENALIRHITRFLLELGAGFAFLGRQFRMEVDGDEYLAAVDAQVKAPDDKPTIGLLLCKTKNKLVAEYALSGMAKPIDALITGSQACR